MFKIINRSGFRCICNLWNKFIFFVVLGKSLLMIFKIIDSEIKIMYFWINLGLLGLYCWLEGVFYIIFKEECVVVIDLEVIGVREEKEEDNVIVLVLLLYEVDNVNIFIWGEIDLEVEEREVEVMVVFCYCFLLLLLILILLYSGEKLI